MGLFNYPMKKAAKDKQPDNYMVEKRIFTKAFVERFTYFMMKSEAIWNQMMSGEECISYHTLEQYLFELDLIAFTHANKKLSLCVGRDRTWSENREAMKYFDYLWMILYQYIENQSSDLRNRDCKLVCLQKMQQVKNGIVGEPYVQFLNDFNCAVQSDFSIPKVEPMTYFLPNRELYKVGVKNNRYLDFVEKILDPESIEPMVLQALGQTNEKKLVL